jgi:hypothetical protein
MSQPGKASFNCRCCHWLRQGKTLTNTHAQMSDTLPIDLNSAALGIGRHVSGIADPF